MECDAGLGTRICAGKKAQGKDKGCMKIQWAIGILKADMAVLANECLCMHSQHLRTL